MSDKRQLKARGFPARIAAGFALISAAARRKARSVTNSSPAVSAKGQTVAFDDDYGWRPFGSGGRWGQHYNGTDLDWEREAGPLWENPAISLCLGFLFDKVLDAIPRVYSAEDSKQQRTVLNDHPLTAFLPAPNPEYSWDTLLQATGLSLKLAGDGYWVKVRGLRGAGPVREVYYIPHWQMEPVVPEDGGPTKVFKRTVGKNVEFYAKDDVVHFRRGWNPRNPRKGWSAFLALFREVVTDSEIATFTATILRNLGVVGMLVSPANKEDEFDANASDELSDRLTNKSTGDLRASVVVSDIPVKIDKVSYSPAELAVDKLGTRPDARLTSAFGFNAMAIGLPSDDKKYANLKESRAACWEDGLIPLLSLIAKTITTQLLPEFDPTPGIVFGFDLSLVRDLIPDLVSQQKRSRDNFQQGIWTLDESRLDTGKPKDETGKGGKYSFELLVPKQTGAGGADNDAGDGTGNGDA